MTATSLDSFKSRKTLKVGSKNYTYFSLKAAEKNGLKGISKLPYSLKVLLENLLRHEDGRSVTKADIEGIAAWLKNRGKDEMEIAFRPARVLMQDFHRGSRRGRSGRDARCDEGAWKKSNEDQSAGTCRSRHRPFGDGGLFCLNRRLQEKR